MKLLRSAWVFAGILLVAPAVSAVPASELVARSRAAAAREDWNTAARALEELVAAGIDSGDVLYDLGTLYARAGRYGEAIWRLEQASRRGVWSSDAQHNLRVARVALAHRDAGRTGRAVVETAPPPRAWFAELVPYSLAVVCAVFFQLAMLGCLWRWRRVSGPGAEVQRAGFAAAALLLGVLTVFLQSVLVARVRVIPAGVVLRDGVRLLHAPAEDAIADATVREGERLELVGREGTFVRVQAATGAFGWVRAREVGALGD